MTRDTTATETVAQSTQTRPRPRSPRPARRPSPDRTKTGAESGHRLRCGRETRVQVARVVVAAHEPVPFVDDEMRDRGVVANEGERPRIRGVRQQLRDHATMGEHDDTLVRVASGDAVDRTDHSTPER